MKFSFVLAVLFGLALTDPQIIWLKNYNSASTNNIVQVETGGKLFIASNDDLTLLQKIKVQSGNSQMTMNQIPVQGMQLQSNQLIVQSSVDVATVGNLTGYLYAITASQANDNTFEVKVVTQQETITETGTKKTLVLLNTQFKPIGFPSFDQPEKTTYVTDVTQDQNTALNFHHGYPGADWNKVTEKQFFENPQSVIDYDENGVGTEKKVFFASVEPIQVNLPYWYITANGPFSMKLNNIYMNVHNHNTTNANTTGAFILNDVYQDHYVNFATDPSRGGMTGILVTTDLQYQVNVNFYGDYSKFVNSFSGANGIIHGQLMSSLVSKNLTISATAIYPGTLYCQYFVYTGDLLPSTTSTTIQSTTTTTTSTVATTTKSSGGFDLMMSLFIFGCTLWKYQN